MPEHNVLAPALDEPALRRTALADPYAARQDADLHALGIDESEQAVAFRHFRSLTVTGGAATSERHATKRRKGGMERANRASRPMLRRRLPSRRSGSPARPTLPSR